MPQASTLLSCFLVRRENFEVFEQYVHCLIDTATFKLNCEVEFSRLCKVNKLRNCVCFADVLDLHGNACRSTRSPAGIGFLRLLETSDVALECIFAESMITLDELWLQRGATYMEFQLVQRELRWRVHRTLGRRWLRTLQHLETLRTDYR